MLQDQELSTGSLLLTSAGKATCSPLALLAEVDRNLPHILLSHLLREFFIRAGFGLLLWTQIHNLFEPLGMTCLQHCKLTKLGVPFHVSFQFLYGLAHVGVDKGRGFKYSLSIVKISNIFPELLQELQQDVKLVDTIDVSTLIMYFSANSIDPLVVRDCSPRGGTLA